MVIVMSKEVIKNRFLSSLVFYWRKEVGWPDFSDVLKILVNSTENFLESSHQKFRSKEHFLSEYSNLILSFIFSKTHVVDLIGTSQNLVLGFFHFPSHAIWLLCLMVAMFYWRKNLGLPYRSDTLNILVKVTKHFLKTFGNKNSVRKWGFGIIFLPDFELRFFQNRNFFQKILENYSRALRTYSMYLFNLVLYSSKKSWPYDTLIKSYFIKSEKSWFLKKWNSNWVGILW